MSPVSYIFIMTSKTRENGSNYLYNDPYSIKNILVFELIFGKSYISPGGEESATYFSGLLELKEGQKVLDVACGCGGPAFLMARYFDSNIFPVYLISKKGKKSWMLPVGAEDRLF